MKIRVLSTSLLCIMSTALYCAEEKVPVKRPQSPTALTAMALAGLGPEYTEYSPEEALEKSKQTALHRFADTQSVAGQSNPFEALTELVQENIVSFMPDEDLASLTLTNRTLHKIVEKERKTRAQNLIKYWGRPIRENAFSVNNVPASVVFSRDSKFLAVAELDGLKLWNLETGERQELPEKLSGIYGIPRKIKFLPSGKLAVIRTWGIASWDFKKGPEPKNMCLNKFESSLSFADVGGNKLAIPPHSGTTTLVYDLETNVGQKITRSLPTTAMDYRTPPELLSPDGKLLMAKAGRLWDVENVNDIKEIPLPPSISQLVRFSPDSKFIAADLGRHESGIARLAVLDASRMKNRNGDPIIFTWHSPLKDVAFSTNGYLATAGDDAVLLWKFTEPPLKASSTKSKTDLFNIERRLPGGSDRIVFLPGNTILASLKYNSPGNSIITLWNVLTGEIITTLNGYYEESKIIVSPDGKKIAVYEDDRDRMRHKIVVISTQ